MTLRLDDADRAMLHGEAGDGAAMAMEVLASYADAIGAEALIPIKGGHVDGGCRRRSMSARSILSIPS